MKRILCALLAAMLLLPAFAMADELIPGYYTPPKANEGQYPISDKPVKLTYWMEMNSGAANFISSYDENPAYQQIQKDTGVDIEFWHPSAGTKTKQAFQTLLMSGELPDMIQIPAETVYSGGLKALYEDGVIIDVAPYLDKYAPQYKQVLMDNEDAQRVYFEEDGKILGFSKMTYSEPMPYIRVNVNKTWLNEFGMDEPKTIEEYEAYFQAILDNKPGVTPLYIKRDNAEHWSLFMGAFDMLKGFFVDPDGKTVHHWSNAPKYKEFLTLMHSWYEKGYLSRDFSSLTIAEAQTMFDNQKLGAICDSVDATYTRINTLGNFEVTNCPYPRLTEDQVIGNNLATFPTWSYITVITTACKNVEAAVQYLNYGYTYEGSLLFTFGVEGTHWNYDEAGIPRFTDEILKNPKGMTISNVSYALKIHFGTRYCYPDSIGHPSTASNTEALRIRTMWNSDKNEQSFLRIPALTMSTDDSARAAELMAQVNTYAEEMLLKFITGAEPLENFDKYSKDVMEYGLEEALKLYQTAMDRYLGK